MSRSFGCGNRGWLALIGVGLIACNIDSDLRNSQGSPVTRGVMLSGAGAADDENSEVGFGDDSAITDIVAGGSKASVGESAGGTWDTTSAGTTSAGTDSGGASDERAGGIGGAAGSNRGGAAGAGSMAGQAGISAAGSNRGGGGPAEAPSLLFSEYVEGSSANKALEISAEQRSVLDDCKVGTYFNGKIEVSVVALLSGVLEAGQVLTLCTSTLKAKLGSVCKQVGNLTFNGNDAVSLSCGGKILDVIGRIGVDPGTAWGMDPTTTLDHTLRRKCSISAGRVSGTSQFDPNLEWQAFPIDTFSGLGARGC